jgi:hypothetical protein
MSDNCPAVVIWGPPLDPDPRGTLTVGPEWYDLPLTDRPDPGPSQLCWYDLIKAAMEGDGEDFAARVCTLTEAELREPFPDLWGGCNGRPFTCWGEQWVYFPLDYDGRRFVGHAPRHPSPVATWPETVYEGRRLPPVGEDGEAPGMQAPAPKCPEPGMPIAWLRDAPPGTLMVYCEGGGVRPADPPLDAPPAAD